MAEIWALGSEFLVIFSFKRSCLAKTGSNEITRNFTPKGKLQPKSRTATINDPNQ